MDSIRSNEPSKSPWARPLLCLRHGKTRMVVDYRKLNEIAIADEFPLPKQEDFSALVGKPMANLHLMHSQFTQLEMTPRNERNLPPDSSRTMSIASECLFRIQKGPSTLFSESFTCNMCFPIFGFLP